MALAWTGQILHPGCSKIGAKIQGCLCAGLPQEGVAALQEAGLWRYAATLTAHTLKGGERAAALERWAAHVHQVCPPALSHLIGA